MNPERNPERSPERKLRVDPQLVYGISLLFALAINWSSLMGAMRGSADIMAVGARLLITVAVVWTGMFMVASLLASYATAAIAKTAAAETLDDADRFGSLATPPLAPQIEADAAAAAAIAAQTESAAG